MTKPIQAYLIYVSALEYKGSTEQLKEFITQNKHVNTWWNYIPFVYVITSSSRITEIKRDFLKFIGKNADVFIAPIDSLQATGLAPTGAWTAFDKDIRQAIHPDYVPQNLAPDVNSSVS